MPPLKHVLRYASGSRLASAIDSMAAAIRKLPPSLTTLAAPCKRWRGPWSVRLASRTQRNILIGSGPGVGVVVGGDRIFAEVDH